MKTKYIIHSEKGSIGLCNYGKQYEHCLSKCKLNIDFDTAVLLAKQFGLNHITELHYSTAGKLILKVDRYI